MIKAGLEGGVLNWEVTLDQYQGYNFGPYLTEISGLTSTVDLNINDDLVEGSEVTVKCCGMPSSWEVDYTGQKITITLNGTVLWTGTISNVSYDREPNNPVMTMTAQDSCIQLPDDWFTSGVVAKNPREMIAYMLRDTGLTVNVPAYAGDTNGVHRSYVKLAMPVSTLGNLTGAWAGRPCIVGYDKGRPDVTIYDTNGRHSTTDVLELTDNNSPLLTLWSWNAFLKNNTNDNSVQMGSDPLFWHNKQYPYWYVVAEISVMYPATDTASDFGSMLDTYGTTGMYECMRYTVMPHCKNNRASMVTALGNDPDFAADVQRFSPQLSSINDQYFIANQHLFNLEHTSIRLESFRRRPNYEKTGHTFFAPDVSEGSYIYPGMPPMFKSKRLRKRNMLLNRTGDEFLFYNGILVTNNDERWNKFSAYTQDAITYEISLPTFPSASAKVLARLKRQGPNSDTQTFNNVTLCQLDWEHLEDYGWHWPTGENDDKGYPPLCIKAYYDGSITVYFHDFSDVLSEWVATEDATTPQVGTYKNGTQALVNTCFWQIRQCLKPYTVTMKPVEKHDLAVAAWLGGLNFRSGSSSFDCVDICPENGTFYSLPLTIDNVSHCEFDQFHPLPKTFNCTLTTPEGEEVSYTIDFDEDGEGEVSTVMLQGALSPQQKNVGTSGANVYSLQAGLTYANVGYLTDRTVGYSYNEQYHQTSAQPVSQPNGEFGYSYADSDGNLYSIESNFVSLPNTAVIADSVHNVYANDNKEYDLFCTHFIGETQSNVECAIKLVTSLPTDNTEPFLDVSPIKSLWLAYNRVYGDLRRPSYKIDCCLAFADVKAGDVVAVKLTNLHDNIPYQALVIQNSVSLDSCTLTVVPLKPLANLDSAHWSNLNTIWTAVNSVSPTPSSLVKSLAWAANKAIYDYKTQYGPGLADWEKWGGGLWHAKNSFQYCDLLSHPSIVLENMNTHIAEFLPEGELRYIYDDVVPSVVDKETLIFQSPTFPELTFNLDSEYFNNLPLLNVEGTIDNLINDYKVSINYPYYAYRLSNNYDEWPPMTQNWQSYGDNYRRCCRFYNEGTAWYWPVLLPITMNKYETDRVRLIIGDKEYMADEGGDNNRLIFPTAPDNIRNLLWLESDENLHGCYICINAMNNTNLNNCVIAWDRIRAEYSDNYPGW